MTEIWKDIKGYEGIYELRNDGLLHSFQRNTTKGGYTYGNKCYNYYIYNLSKNGIEEKIRMHNLVYETFVGKIPKGYVVHHINHNGLDNRVENLELMENSEHQKMHFNEHKEKTMKAKNEKRSKPVRQYTLDGSFIAEYPSAREAERQTGVLNSDISKCCRGLFKQAGGYIWKR